MAGRPSRQRALDAWMNGQRVGRWSVGAAGVHHFAYDTAWPASPQARPLSLSLPLGAAKGYRGARVQAWFDRLLPATPLARQRLQALFGVHSSDTFDLLAALGADCPGAVQLLPPDAAPPDPQRIDAERLSERELVRALDACAAPPGTALAGESKLPAAALAGAQAKTALLWHDGHWCRPFGATPSTHILKLPLGATPGGGPALSSSLENEWLCSRLLQAYGFEVAPLRIDTIGPHKVGVIERFDRRWVDARWWARLPMENAAQATGTPLASAFDQPGVARVLDLLRGSDRAAHDRERLLAAMVVMWMLAVPDLSARRFHALLLPGGHHVLAPLGGVMSAWPLLGRTPSPASFKRLPWAWPPDGTARLHHEITPALWRGVARHQAIGAHFDAVLDGLASWTERAIDAVSAQLPAGFPGSLSHTVFEGLRRSARTLAP